MKTNIKMVIFVSYKTNSRVVMSILMLYHYFLCYILYGPQKARHYAAVLNYFSNLTMGFLTAIRINLSMVQFHC